MQAQKPNLMNTHLTLHEFRLGFVRVRYNMDFLGTRLEEEISERKRYILKREREIWRRMRNRNWVIIKMAWRYRFFSKPH